MTEVIAFKPHHQLNCEKNLHDFIIRAKNNLTKYEDQGGFEATVWKNQLSSGTTQSMSFTSFKDGIEKANVFKQSYLNFGRAYIRDLQSWKVRNPASYMLVLKCIYEALLLTHDSADILLLDNVAFRKAVEIMENRVTAPVLYRGGEALESFLQNLVNYGINYKLSPWKNPWTRPREKGSRTDVDSRKWQEERLLSDYDIGVMADAFRLAKTPYEKYYSSLMVLLMATPSRGGELNFLTTDCLFEEIGLTDEKNPITGQIDRVEKKVLKIRWQAEKGGGFISKPIHPALEETVKEAVQRLINIGKPAREACKWSIEHPDKFYRHNRCVSKGEFEALTVKEFCQAMRLSYKPYSNELLNSIEIGRIDIAKKTKWVKDLLEKKIIFLIRI